MNLDALQEHLQSAGLYGVSYSDTDFENVEQLLGATTPVWYRNIATQFPIANLRYRLDNVDLVIPHPIQLRFISTHDSRFHFEGDGDDGWFPFAIAPDDQSDPLWLIPIDTTEDPMVWAYGDYYSPASDIGISLSTILSSATIIENVTANPDFLPDFDTRHSPSNIDGLRYEPSMPPQEQLNRLQQAPRKA